MGSFLCSMAHFVGFEVVIKEKQLLKEEVGLGLKSCQLTCQKLFFLRKEMAYYYVHFKQLDRVSVSVKIMLEDHGFEHTTHPETWKLKLTTLSPGFSPGVS